MLALAAALLLASPWSITDGPDSLASPPARVVLPVRQGFELGGSAWFTANTEPAPKNPRGWSAMYEFSWPAARAHWREWLAIGCERAEWESPDPVRVIGVIDSTTGFPYAVWVAGTHLRRFGFVVQSGVDRMLGDEARPQGYAGAGLVLATGDATVFQAGSAYDSPFNSVGAAFRLGGLIPLTRQARLSPRARWVPSYVFCSAPGTRGFHQQLVLSLVLDMPMSIPARKAP